MGISPRQTTFLEKFRDRVNCEKMDNLIPYMIGNVVSMIDYLQGKSNVV